MQSVVGGQADTWGNTHKVGCVLSAEGTDSTGYSILKLNLEE